MPPAVKKKQQKNAPAPAAQTGAARPVVFPEITVNGVPIPREKTRLTHDQLVDMFHFETESEYRRRLEASEDPAERVKAAAGFGDEFLPGSPEMFGEKVRCWNNMDNRPFDPPTAEKYCQDGGERRWAGWEMAGNEEAEMLLADGTAVRLPLFTPNGETIIVGRTGKVMSGQHRGLGFILLVRRWREDPSRYPLWAVEPFLETLVVFGVSEHPDVVRSLDNVRPRTTADTVYTSEIFKWNPDGSQTTQRQRKDLSRLLDDATDLLWKRTGAAFDGRLQTHAASHDFIKNHERIKAAVRFVHDLNDAKETSRSLSLLYFKLGDQAAALYLMGASKSDEARYAADRREAALDLGEWKKAEQFFARLAKAWKKDAADKPFKALRHAIGQLHSLDDGMGGRPVEKLALLALAWTKFRLGEDFSADDLELAYNAEKTKLLDPPTFGGIDLGPDPSPPERVSRAEAERNKEEARKRKAEEAIDAAGGRGGPAAAGKTFGQILEALQAQHANAILFFRDDRGDYNVYGEDADTLGRELNTDLRKGPGGVRLVTIPAVHFETTVRQLTEDGYNLKTVALTDGEATVTEVRPRGKKPAAEPDNGKPAPAAPKGANGAQTGPAPKAGPKATKKVPALRGGTN